MKIAITGANGFVGLALSGRLKQSHQLLLISRRSIADANENIITTNFHTSDVINALNGCQCVIHLAAKTHSGAKLNNENLTLYRSVNVDASLDLAKSALAAGVKRFIYLSSIKVNGEQTYDVPFRATDTPSPEDAYGVSKWEAEQALRHFFAGTDVELVVVRSPLIWSRGQIKGNLKLLKQWSDWGLPLPLGGTKNKRDLISIDNLCDFLTLCIDHANAQNKTFLVSDGTPRSTTDIVSLIISNPRIISLPPWFLRLTKALGWGRKLFGNLEVDIQQTTKTTGWRPTETY